MYMRSATTKMRASAFGGAGDGQRYDIARCPLIEKDLVHTKQVSLLFIELETKLQGAMGDCWSRASMSCPEKAPECGLTRVKDGNPGPELSACVKGGEGEDEGGCESGLKGTQHCNGSAFLSFLDQTCLIMYWKKKKRTRSPHTNERRERLPSWCTLRSAWPWSPIPSCTQEASSEGRSCG